MSNNPGSHKSVTDASVAESEADATKRRLHDEMCTREGDAAHEAANKDQAEYDKQLLTLSVGFLAISLGFIKDIVKLDHAIYRGCLYTSFMLLVSSVLLVLFSFQFSAQGNLKARAYWEELKTNENAEFPYSHSIHVMWLNRISGTVFALGIVLTVIFVIVNIHQEAIMSNESKSVLVTEGQYVKLPAAGEILQRGLLMKAPSPPPAPATTVPTRTAPNPSGELE